jgi:CBS-domain-containing membrane protein
MAETVLSPVEAQGTAGGQLSGLLTLAALRQVLPNARPTTLINAIICPLDGVPTVSPRDPATNLLELSDLGCSEGRTLVVDNGRLVGIISPSDINRLLQRSSLGRAQAPVSSGAAGRGPSVD